MQSREPSTASAHEVDVAVEGQLSDKLNKACLLPDWRTLPAKVWGPSSESSWYYHGKLRASLFSPAAEGLVVQVPDHMVAQQVRINFVFAEQPFVFF